MASLDLSKNARKGWVSIVALVVRSGVAVLPNELFSLLLQCDCRGGPLAYEVYTTVKIYKYIAIMDVNSACILNNVRVDVITIAVVWARVCTVLSSEIEVLSTI